MKSDRYRLRTGTLLRRQFSLKALLAVILLLSVWLSVSVNRMGYEKAALDEISMCGGEVGYRWTVFYPFRTVEIVSLTGRAFTDAKLQRVAIHLESLPNLSLLQIIQTSITDHGLEHLNRLHRIRRLDLVDNDITDNGLPDLVKHPALVELDLSATLISDAGLQQLQSLKSLKKLSLPGGPMPLPAGMTSPNPQVWRGMQEIVEATRPPGSVSEAAIARFQAILPWCRILHTHFPNSSPLRNRYGPTVPGRTFKEAQALQKIG